MAGPGSPVLPIARPETLSPHIVAVSVAERYVADLVGQCQTIASLFEVEVPIPISRVTASAPLECGSESSLGIGSLADPPSPLAQFASFGEEPSSSPSCVPDLQLSPSPLPSRWASEATSPSRATKASVPTSPVCDELSWGGPRVSESIRLKRLLDPEFRRRGAATLGRSQRQTNPAPHRSLDFKDTACDTQGSRLRHHPNVQPPSSSSKQHRPSLDHTKEAAPPRRGLTRGRTFARGRTFRLSTGSEHNAEHRSSKAGVSFKHQFQDRRTVGPLHNELSHLEKKHENASPERSPRPASGNRAVRFTQAAKMHKHGSSGGSVFQQASEWGAMRSQAHRVTKMRAKNRMAQAKKAMNNFDKWRVTAGEAQRNQPRVEPVEEEEEKPDPLKESGLKDDLRHAFRDVAQKKHKNDMIDDTVNGWELHQIAQDLQMSVDDVLLVKSVFDSFDDNRSGTLDIDEFEMAVDKLLQLQLREQMVAKERVKSMCEWYWWDGDKDGSGTIDFREFLRWYSSNGFNEDLLLTEQQRALRKIAKQHNVSADYVETIKRCFDSIDQDKSNEVDINEFKQILYKALKVPLNFELPASRVAYFWSEIDTDGSGQAGFEEFFSWWVKYFDASGGSRQMPFEAFYKQVRRIGAKYLDPPAYPSIYKDAPSGDDEDMPGVNWLENMCNA